MACRSLCSIWIIDTRLSFIQMPLIQMAILKSLLFRSCKYISSFLCYCSFFLIYSVTFLVLSYVWISVDSIFCFVLVKTLAMLQTNDFIWLNNFLNPNILNVMATNIPFDLRQELSRMLQQGHKIGCTVSHTFFLWNKSCFS